MKAEIKQEKNLVQLLDTLSKDHEISVSENVANLIESELDVKGITKFSKKVLDFI